MPKLFYKDLWGRRQAKYSFLEASDITTLDWQALNPQEPHYFFVPKDFSLKGEYEAFWSVKDIFQKFSFGVTTARDHFVVGFTKQEIIQKLKVFTGNLPDELVKDGLKLKDTGEWNLHETRQKAQGRTLENNICLYSYRPFDSRWICYESTLIERDRKEIMQHILDKENIGLNLTRRLRDAIWQHSYVSNSVTDKTLISSKDNSYFFPLYLYSSDNPPLLKGGGGFVSKVPNLKPEFLNAIKESISYEPSPEDIFYYIYAVLYSQAYRKKYQEFLKIDFPRIPLPENKDIFENLSKLGNILADLHLLKSEISNQQSAMTVGYPIQGSDKVDAVKYKSDRVHINKEQYFEGIPEDVWNYHIGSYQVLEKFLKDRKVRKLSLDEIQRYLKIISAIARTIEIQKEIDRVWQI